MIRKVCPEDVETVDALLTEAFEGRGEADLVAALRRSGDLELELVAQAEGAIVGHAAFPGLRSDVGAALAALAPLAVDAKRRRRGIGESLARRGLTILGERGVAWCLVLGDPAFYGRLGFSADAATGFRTPFDGPCQLAARLAPDAAKAQGRVFYPPAFAALG